MIAFRKFDMQVRALRHSVCLSPMLLIAVIVAQVSVGQAQTLVWQEEFTNGIAPDPTTWTAEIGNGCPNLCGWGNAELQSYTSDSANLRVEGGNLIITAVRQGNSFTSARIKTQDKLTFKYGTVEARIKVPDLGNGLWPAFWTLGNNIPSVGWPACGEIDVLEMGSGSAISAGVVNRRVGSTAHWDNPGYAAYGLSYTSPTNLNDSFHVFRMEWTPFAITTYIDNIWIWSIDTTPSGLSEFHQPHFFLLNLAVGGNYTGITSPGGITAPFPAEYVIDWIRLYDEGDTELGGSSVEPPPPPPTAGTNALVNPGFETGVVSPWVAYSFGGANDLGTYIESTSNTYYNGGNPGGDNVLTHSGTYVGKIYGDFTGGQNDNGCYQEVLADPGSIWNADGWALTHAQDLMQAGNTTWIEVSFRNDANTILALYRSEVLNSGNVSVSSWMHLQVTNQLNPSTLAVTNTTSTLTAPAGTTKARYQVIFRQPVYQNGAMYYDDLNLVLQPVVAPVALNAVLVGNNIQISFDTQNGVNYDVAYKNNLTDSSWTVTETVAGDGTTKSVSYPASNPIRFYTVQTP